MGIFNKIFDGSTESVGDSEVFIRLIQVAKEDKNIHKSLVSILSMDSFQRKSAMGSLIEDMRLKGAPKDFVAAIAILRDDAIAEKALAILIDTSGKSNL